MNKRILTFGGVAIAAALLISINVISNASLRSTRIDLTEERLFTVSDGAKGLLGKLQEDVTLRLYYSREQGKNYPQIDTYARRVEELLLEMQTHAKGKLTVETIDPEPYSETEERAVALGVKGMQVPNSQDLLYFGLAGTNTTDEKQAIPFLEPDKEQFLEYDLAKLIYSLSNPSKKVVGVMSTLPIEGAMANPFTRGPGAEPWLMIEQLRQLYEVRTVMPTVKEIPTDLSLLMVIHPKALSPQTQFALDQYVLGGGRAMIFVDPFCEADQPPADPNNPMAQYQAVRNSDLGALFTAWGLQMEAGKIAADLEHSLRVQFSNRSRDDSGQYVVWLGLDASNLAKDQVVTDAIKTMNLATAGVLTKLDGATTTVTPLVQTGDRASTVMTSSVQFNQDPKALLNDYMAGDRALVLAAHVTGNVKSAFPAGRPADVPVEGEETPATPPEDKPVLTESKAPISVIVVTDCDMLADGWSFRAQNIGGFRMASPANGNMAFVANSLDFLEGSTDLISLRSRGSSYRPFKVVEDLKKVADQRYRAREQELVAKFDEANQRIENLLSKRQGESLELLSQDVQAEIEKATEERIQTQRELREVRRALNRDIEALGTRVKAINIALIPALLVAFALGLSRWQRLRRKS